MYWNNTLRNEWRDRYATVSKRDGWRTVEDQINSAILNNVEICFCSTKQWACFGKWLQSNGCGSTNAGFQKSGKNIVFLGCFLERSLVEGPHMSTWRTIAGRLLPHLPTDEQSASKRSLYMFTGDEGWIYGCVQKRKGGETAPIPAGSGTWSFRVDAVRNFF